MWVVTWLTWSTDVELEERKKKKKKKKNLTVSFEDENKKTNP